MRNQKEVKIQIDAKTHRVFIVYEVRPLDVRQMLQTMDMGGSLLDLAQKNLHLFTDATVNDLEALYPGDMALLWEAWKEVNRPLFQAARALGLGPLRERLTGLLVNDLTDFALGLLRTVTPSVGSTAGDSSSPLSMSAPADAKSA